MDMIRCTICSHAATYAPILCRVSANKAMRAIVLELAFGHSRPGSSPGYSIATGLTNFCWRGRTDET